MRWFLVALVACSGRVEPGPAVPAPASSLIEREVDLQPTMQSGIQLVLTDAVRATDPPVDRNPVGEPLAPKDLATLLRRAAPLQAGDGDRKTFKLPAETLNPPDRDLVAVDAPSSAVPVPDVPTGPVQVLRFAPEGDVDIAPKLSITFDRPMVAVSSVEVTRETVPVTLEPEVEGQWRWLGTRTLVFEPTKRLPMATEFRIQTRESLRSANGEAMAKPFGWTVRTPPPKLSQGMLGASFPLDPLIVLRYDQPMDPEVVLAKATLSPGTPLRLATDEEAAAYGRSPQVVLLKPTQPLKLDTKYQVRVGAGVVSTEGPRPTTAVEVAEFQTYGRLKVAARPCGWTDGCPPHYPFQIEATNPLEPSVLTIDQFKVTPAVADLALSASYTYITLQGSFAPRTTYTVEVSADLQDTFGQRLGSPARLTPEAVAYGAALDRIRRGA